MGRCMQRRSVFHSNKNDGPLFSGQERVDLMRCLEAIFYLKILDKLASHWDNLLPGPTKLYEVREEGRVGDETTSI